MDSTDTNKPKRPKRRRNNSSSGNGTKVAKVAHSGKHQYASKSNPNNHLLPSTARPEYAPIIQALKCMSSEEEARFEAYRRCVLPIEAVSKAIVCYLANAILKRASMYESIRLSEGQDVRSRRKSILPTLVCHALEKPQEVQDWNAVLQCLVVPKKSREIATIVGSLAKLHSQRLVNLACREEEASAKAAGCIRKNMSLSFQHFRDAHQAVLSINLGDDIRQSLPQEHLGLRRYQYQAEAVLEAQNLLDEKQKQRDEKNDSIDMDTSSFDDESESTSIAATEDDSGDKVSEKEPG